MKFKTLDGRFAEIDQKDLHALKNTVKGTVLLQGEHGYESARAIWNGIFNMMPSAIVVCREAQDVMKAVTFARTHNILVSVKSGGHSITGNAVCDRCLTIDLSSMRKVSVDPRNMTARAEGGAILSDVDEATQEYGLAVPFGVVSLTGIAGLTLGGGYGHLRRKYGLTIDNLVSVEIVTADGQLLMANRKVNPDIFWGVRGGGGNFGIVTSFEYMLHKVGPEVYLVYVVYSLDDAEDVIHKGKDYMLKDAADEVSAEFQFAKMPETEEYPPEVRGKRVVIVRGMYSGDAEDGKREMDPLRHLAEPLFDNSTVMKYTEVQKFTDSTVPAGMRYYSTGIMADDINDKAMKALVETYNTVDFAETGVTGVWHTGGAISRVGPEETPYSARDNNFMIVIDLEWTDPSNDKEQIEWGRKLKKKIMDAFPDRRESGYINFQPGDNNRSEVSAAYGENFGRLQEIKRKYDPDNFFRLNHNIPP